MPNNIPILIVHEPLPNTSNFDELDTYIQVEHVNKALLNRGYVPIRYPFISHIHEFIEGIKKHTPCIAFNLVESFCGYNQCMHFAPDLFDALHIPFTGVSGLSLQITTNKVFSKQMLSAHGIGTPLWQTISDIEKNGLQLKVPFIAKPQHEDASKGITDSSVFFKQDAFWDFFNEHREMLYKKAYFIEQYVEGREFNISLISHENTVHVFPIAEMLFTNFPEDKPRIVNYDAKWNSRSFEFHNTIRNFTFSEQDSLLLQALEKTSIHCWDIFDLQGYARIDFRVDSNNRIYVIEVNGNPCISPDSGFIAAGIQGGYSFDHIVEMIVLDALQKKGNRIVSLL